MLYLQLKHTIKISNQIEIKGIIINLQKFNDSDYVSLTDIVKGQEDRKHDQPNLIKVFDDSLEINRFSKQMLQDRGELPKEEE